MRPADTDVVPERRYYKSVPHARGKEKKLSHGGKLRKNTKVQIQGAKVRNSDPEVG